MGKKALRSGGSGGIDPGGVTLLVGIPLHEGARTEGMPVPVPGCRRRKEAIISLTNRLIS